MGEREAPLFADVRRPRAVSAFSSFGAPRGVAPVRRDVTPTAPAPPSDGHGLRGALRRAVLVTFLAIVVAGAAVPAITKVEPPAKVTQATKAPRPSVESPRPRPVVRRRGAPRKTTPPHLAT